MYFSTHLPFLSWEIPSKDAPTAGFLADSNFCFFFLCVTCRFWFLLILCSLKKLKSRENKDVKIIENELLYTHFYLIYFTQLVSLTLCFHYCELIYLALLYSFWFTQLIFVSSPPVFRHITLDCGSKGRPRPRKNVGWNSRNPSRSSWTSLAMSHCSSLESCSMFPMFPGWSKKPPGKESSNGNCETVTQVTERAT